MKLLIGGLVALTAISLTAPAAHATPGDQTSAEAAVTAIYNQVQKACTPRMTPSLQSIVWGSFIAGSGGEGRIVDASPGLGGPFNVSYGATGVPYRPYGQWGVNLQFC